MPIKNSVAIDGTRTDGERFMGGSFLDVKLIQICELPMKKLRRRVKREMGQPLCQSARARLRQLPVD
jgi:hypothetical protein